MHSTLELRMTCCKGKVVYGSSFNMCPQICIQSFEIHNQIMLPIITIKSHRLRRQKVATDKNNKLTVDHT